MNCAPNDASYSASFVSRNRSSTSRWRPNALTMACPVNVSSIWPFSARRCCATARCTGAEPACRSHRIDVDRDRHGRERHHGEQRRDREHHDRDADEQQDRGEHLADRLLQALREVVEVVGDAAQQVAASLAVDVAEREHVELGLGLLPQAEHQALHDAGEGVGDGDADGRGARRRAARPRGARGAAARSRCPSAGPDALR